jgi:enamine deaminase RidA (YjgF/YER057c/UK114 family)
MRSTNYTLTALVLGFMAVPALGGARQDAKVLMEADPAGLKFQEEWGYANAVITGDTIYLSGVVAGLLDGESDFVASYERAFARIGTILKNAGASWDDVIDITSFHTDVTKQLPAIVAVKNRYVRAPYPAWTAIQVLRLTPENGITEIKIVAKLSK